MRRTVVFILVIHLLTFCACSAGTAEYEKDFQAFREMVSASDSVTVSAQVRADYGDTVGDFTLRCTRTAEETAVEVLEPALIAGIRAHMTQDGSVLEYDGAILDMGDLTPDGLTPVSALLQVLQAIENGHLQRVWHENTGYGEALAAEIFLTDSDTMTLWISADASSPLAAEIASGGRTVFSCTFTDWETS